MAEATRASDDEVTRTFRHGPNDPDAQRTVDGIRTMIEAAR